MPLPNPNCLNRRKKMRSPADMEIIQIDITNACPHLCSNCTRFCGHHKKPFFMDEATFRKAAESMKGFSGTVGIMGGEPTLHPKFEELLNIYRDILCPGRELDAGREPIADFSAHSQNLLQGIEQGVPGLWTSLGAGYAKHFEIIQEIFSFQAINDHTNAGLHQALLISRKDLGVSDEEWFQLRDKCWIQNLWSAAITPKGAFFCEVAAALDMLFDGPGGWPVEPGWWKRTPDEFGDQLNWCEMCSAALNVPRNVANTKIDTISKSVSEKLQSTGSIKYNRGMVEVFDPDVYDPKEFEVDPNNIWFLPESSDSYRVSGTCESIKSIRLNAVVFSKGMSQEQLAAIEKHFYEIKPVQNDAEFLQAVDELDKAGWIAVLDEGTELHPDFGERIRNTVFNPGCLYSFGARAGTESGAPAGNRVDGVLPHAFYLFHKRARALRTTDWKSAADLPAFTALWPDEKRIELTPDFDRPKNSAETISLPVKARHAVSTVQLLQSLGREYAIFGAGKHTHWLLEQFVSAKATLPNIIYDDSPAGDSVFDVPIQKPETSCAVDTIVLGTDTYGESMTARCRELWGSAVNVIDLYTGFCS